MPVLTHPMPAVSEADAKEILAAHWKQLDSVRPLPGERERNFHVYTAEGAEFVLKVASPLEDAAAIELQVEALEHLARVAPRVPVPRVVAAADGRRIVPHMAGGEACNARLLTWLPGRPLAKVSPHPPALLHGIGQSLDAITAALSTFEHRAARRALKWDLAEAGWIADHLDRVTDAGQRTRIERVLAEFSTHVRPALDATRTSVVHNDANDYNILVVAEQH